MTRRLQFAWALSAACVLMFSAALTTLSFDFIYGVEHSARPILPFLAAYGVGCLGLLGAVLLAQRRGPTPSAACIVGVAIIARLLLLPSHLVQENDCYRYVLDGMAMLEGVNPFAHAPEDVVFDAPAALMESAETPEGQRIMHRVGYPEVPTIYPPLAQLAFTVGAWLTPWDWMGQRIVFLLGDLATVALLILILRRRGQPPAWAVLYAWNPLILKEIANSAHLDSLVGLGLAVFIFFVDRWIDGVGRARRNLIGMALGMSAAILTKLYPVLLLAPALVFVERRANFRKAALWGIGLAALCIASVLPFMGVGIVQLTEGLRTYGGEWIRNEGLYELVAAVYPEPRGAAAGLVGIAALLSAMHVSRRHGDRDALLAAIQWTMLIWLLVMPAVFPWYAIGLLAVTALRPRLWAVVLSTALGAYYFIFYVEYNDLAWTWNTWTRRIEHGAIWLAVIAEPLWRLWNAEGEGPRSDASE